MAKKVTIPGEGHLQSLDDDWGGINNTDKAIEKYGATVPPGQEWGMNRGEVERFEKHILQEHEASIGDNANDIATLGGVAIGEVEEGAVNPATRKKPIHFYKANDPEHEHPVTIEVAANVGGEEQRPKITVSLNTANTIKKGDTIDFDWVYDFIHIDEEGNVVTGGIRPTPQNVTIEVKAGNTLIYSDTVNGGVVEHQPYNVRFANPNVTGMVTITVVATVVIDGEVAEARGGEVVNIVEMRLALDSTQANPASQLVSGGYPDGQVIRVWYSYAVPRTGTTTLYVYIDGTLHSSQTISGTGRNGVELLASEYDAGRHNVQMVAENVNGETTLVSNAVVMDFLKAGDEVNEYLGVMLSVDVTDLEEFEDLAQSYAYGETAFPIKVEQYGSVNIDYAAWNRNSVDTEVRVYVDGEETPRQTLSVNRNLQSLSQRFDDGGIHMMMLQVGENASIGFIVEVQEIGGITETEKPLYTTRLSALGRSNSESEPARSNWGGITTFNGVDWNTNGWNTDSDGVTSMLLTNGAYMDIDLRPFRSGNDYSIHAKGMALGMKVKVSQVMERGATVMSCLYDNDPNDNDQEGTYPTGIQMTTQEARLLFGGKREIETAEDLVDEYGNYIDYEGNIVDEENKVKLKIAEASGVTAKIVTDKWLDIYYVALPTTGQYGLAMLFINGELKRANRYEGQLIQDMPQSIRFDSDKADIRIQKVIYYEVPMISDEVIGNWIDGLNTAVEKRNAHARNDVGSESGTVDADGNIEISSEQLETKGRGVLYVVRSEDKATADAAPGTGRGLDDLFRCKNKSEDFRVDYMKWMPPKDANGDYIGAILELYNIIMRIQGTSSVKYPWKNLRAYLMKAFGQYIRRMIVNGVEVTSTAKGYALRGNDLSIEQAVLCFKTDFVDSSMAGNTGGAHLFDHVMRTLGLLTPPQQYDTRVRQSIDGIPCDIFAATSMEGPFTYYGQFVFNNEKSKSGKIFGMDGVKDENGNAVQWENPITFETLNNASPVALFQSAGTVNGTEEEAQRLEAWLDQYFDDGMEFNFPEDHAWVETPKLAAATEAHRTAIRNLFSFIYDCMKETPFYDSVTHTVTVPQEDYGTPAGWSDTSKAKWRSNKFKTEAHLHFGGKTANDIKHTLTYLLIILYLAGKDQLVKNILWRTWNGLRWWAGYYDGDTWEAIRNDAFIKYLYDIIRDSYDTERSKYAFEGHSSWLWCLVLANFEDELKECASELRANGVFDNNTILNEIIDTMIGNWSERQYNKSGKLKYIDTIETANYVYTLTGSRREHIEAFLRDRAKLLDAQYGVGNYNNDVVELTVVRAVADENHPVTSILITSGDKYCYGYRHTNGGWVQGPTMVDNNGQIELLFGNAEATNDPVRIGGASCIKELDLTGMGSQLNGDINFSNCSIMTKLVAKSTNGAANGHWSFGNISRLLYVDVTGQTSIDTGIDNTFDLRNQRRLGVLKAGGTNFGNVRLPEGAPVTELVLPSTLNTLNLRYLPQLTMEGLTIQGYTNIRGFNFSNCPKLDWKELLDNCTGVTRVRVEGVKGKISPEWLQDFKNRGVKGYDESGSPVEYPALVGTVTLTKVIDDEELAELRRYFHDEANNSLTIIECQYSVYELDDAFAVESNGNWILSSACVKNMENGSMANDTEGHGYVASGHAVKVREKMVPLWGRLRTIGEDAGKWVGREMSGTTYGKYANGQSIDPYGNDTDGNDAMMLLPHCWYKGVNDFKNHKKYIIWSGIENGEGIPPQSSSSSMTRKKLSELEKRAGKFIFYDSSMVDSGNIDDVLVSESGYNVYSIGVEGMKQVRWPGLISEERCACFIDGEGNIKGMFQMYNTHRSDLHGEVLDLQPEEGDYWFCDIPEGATTFMFTALSSANENWEVIAVDSTEVEAIEPDWVEHKECLVGLYQASLDGSNRLRSLTGKTVRRGTVSADNSTSSGWNYDESTGDPINEEAPSNLKYSMKDIQNLSRLRGEGYQLIDYEMSKFVALLFYCLTGTLNSQAAMGQGSYQTTTGYLDSIGNGSTPPTQTTGNKCLGLESWFACVYEWCDNVGVNITSYINFYKNHMAATGSSNGRWWIYDPITGTERYVKGCMVATSSSGGYIKRVRHGRYCDLVPIVVNGTSTSRYADYYYYTTTTNRVLGRSYDYGYANGGVAYAYANIASSYAYTNFGSRLAFRGDIEISEE